MARHRHLLRPASFRTKFGVTESDFKVVKRSGLTLDELLEEVTGGRSLERCNNVEFNSQNCFDWLL